MKLKTIAYRGGLVTFQLPADWIEEYEDDGGGTFYKDRADSGTLRLSVLTFQAPPGMPLPAPVAVLNQSPRAARGHVVPLPNGTALLTACESAREGPTPLLLYFWHIAQQVPPSHGRIAIFTYTIAAAMQSTRLIRNELAFLNECLPKSRLAQALGVLSP